MRKAYRIRSAAVVLSVVLSLALLTGCAKKAAETVSQPAAQTPAAQGTQAESSPAVVTEPAPEPDMAVHVSSVKELLEAIAPGAEIVIEPGRYNLSEFFANYPNVRDLDLWNEEHKYVRLLSVFDGAELMIEGVDGLSISGGSGDPLATELVLEARYGTVLNFHNCKNISLSGLSLGHTEGAYCSGDVVSFDATRGVTMDSMDLYGCGVYGIECNDFAGDISVTNSSIHDCSDAAIEVYNAVGKYSFTDCRFTGSGWGGTFDPSDNTASLSFTRCFFGEWESNCWYFAEEDYISFEECDWSEITSYPDYSYMEDELSFDPGVMTQVSLVDAPLPDTFWHGYITVDPQSGETRELDLFGVTDKPDDYVFLGFSPDGTGEFTYLGETRRFDWNYIDGETACVALDDENAYVSCCRMPLSDGRTHDWLMMQYRNMLIWFF
ncbi:MAG: right-handed parallel beta-helix repeat-containing protein [Oscillospiraceae bacterium]|nr:right-handed parallel beta-helix repeat-containing protein [Oscillospiraceae bacterium]